MHRVQFYCVGCTFDISLWLSVLYRGVEMDNELLTNWLQKKIVKCDHILLETESSNHDVLPTPEMFIEHIVAKVARLSYEEVLDYVKMGEK